MQAQVIFCAFRAFSKPSDAEMAGLHAACKLQAALEEAVKHHEERALSGSQTKRASKDLREVRLLLVRMLSCLCQHKVMQRQSL